jgi:phosphatidylinositol 4-kinase
MMGLNEIYSTSRATRRAALNKLAALSANSAASLDDDRDITRLCALGRQRGELDGIGAKSSFAGGGTATHLVPMSVRELEVLVALCKAAPLVQTTNDAENLLQRLAPYVPEAHQQALAPSSIQQHLPPWETLSHDLTTAVLALGLNHPSLREQVWSCINTTVDALTDSAENSSRQQQNGEEIAGCEVDSQILNVLQLSVSLLGFFNAAGKYVQIWDPERRGALIAHLRNILSEKFMIALEGGLSAVHNTETKSRVVRDWKRWIRHYAAQGQPLGAMLLQHAFMIVVEESVLALLPIPETPTRSAFLDFLLQRNPRLPQVTFGAQSVMVEEMTKTIADEMRLLDANADYILIGTAWQQRVAREVKACSLRSYLCCALLDGDAAHAENLMAWLDTITDDPTQMADEELAQTALKCMAALARISPPIASALTRSLPRLLVQGRMTPPTAAVAGECLARMLKNLPQDNAISVLYSLGNVLSTNAVDQGTSRSSILEGVTPSQTSQRLGSAISLAVSDEEETAIVYASVVQAIVAIAVARSEAQLTALVISVLVQKVGKISQAVDAKIIVETAALGLCGGSNELRGLLRLYSRIASDATVEHNALLLSAVTEARTRLATWIKKDSPLFEVYLLHLTSLCVSSGDSTSAHPADIALSARLMAQVFRPMALLVSTDKGTTPRFESEDELLNLSRDSWFNIVVHGYTLMSPAAKEYTEELQILALYSLPLVDEDRVDMPESSIILNPVLRRGSSPQQLTQQRQALLAALPQCEQDIKSLGYPECVFLNAALLISTLRARGGGCTAALPYFLENKVKTTALGNCVFALSNHCVDTYLRRALQGQRQEFAAPQVALQLASLFEKCCHRMAKVQSASLAACDRMIAQIPSALCQKASLFALLELLSLMWKSCLDAETDEYDWKSHYASEKGNVSIRLSDDINYRQATLNVLHQRGRAWVSRAIEIAPLDVKGLLQAYLEDYEDDGAYGHIALGRSFAVEMGSIVPKSDQRLTSLDRQRDMGVNTASDFIAQYTTRQEYRHLDGRIKVEDDWTLVDYSGKTYDAVTDGVAPVRDEAAELRELAQRLRNDEDVPFEQVRDTLRNAAAILSRILSDRVPLIQDLVAIPFIVFTKQSINLGISLWLGVVKENPSLEARILVEVAQGWETSIRQKRGFFDDKFHHLDPFYIKEEFAPSNWETIVKRQQAASNHVAPHLRLTHFLSSHFNASRLTSPSVEHIYFRLMRVTLLTMRRTVSQPLAREVHFHLILLALKVLKNSTSSSIASQWRLKDAILSAALSWFTQPPRWSYGSNKLQVKAEVKLLGDVTALLKALDSIGNRATASLPSLSPKQELFVQLVNHEICRLMVWITPLAHESRGTLLQHETYVKDSTFQPLLPIAWAEDPRIAIQLVTRFPNSKDLSQAVRALLMRHPEQAINEPDALQVLLGPELPSDVKSQLKYLLYWAPINPMAAVTHFLPAYGNHPYIIQYAVRALESHSVDVTFFYVPQIVQALRYDALGYVERYIVETAKFSQLFAHQIIWNMNANAYKDEESQQPDSIKPMLDKVLAALIASFSAKDKDFYEREFEFFGKVTGISGTLKPLIKRPKPERKAKIEEELRKIEVDVGVYLPSNPEGVVIGIDRKSGRPLQSHAKAPYMATFRIRKEEFETDTPETQPTRNGQITKRKTYEVWQSAIFKVGDDCRQDVLALQLIAAFRGIFNSCGLDVYVFPYRVTATAPGCGVIDVLPNSISRDMLGREAVNGLYEYFVSKYGYEDSIRFQQARSNFIKSMAAYSIISYLLQFKDRHNGNIMVDDAGHILHIDFGFCFDIVPGGVKFERAPFKLTPEMVAVMGGSTQSQPFKAFEELCVKVFLAARQHVEQLAHIVLTMLDSGLPCFKPTTIQHFKERFVLEKSDREAADFVRKLVQWSAGSYSTGVYDYYQLLTNGIPY